MKPVHCHASCGMVTRTHGGSVPRSVSSSWSAESAQAQRMKHHSAQLMAARRQDYCRAKSDATRRRCRIAWLIALSGSLEGASEIVVPQSGKPQVCFSFNQPPSPTWCSSLLGTMAGMHAGIRRELRQLPISGLGDVAVAAFANLRTRTAAPLTKKKAIR